MEKAILGKKVGMTQIFSEKGEAVPVTVVKAGPVTVVQLKTVDKDGYSAVKVAFEDIEKRKVNKPDMGQFKKAGCSPKRYLRELKLDKTDYEIGSEIKCDMFAQGDMVDVTASPRATVSPHDQALEPSQTQDDARRRPRPQRGRFHGRELHSLQEDKGIEEPGRYGHERVTIQNLEIVKVDTARDVLLIRGAVPGPRGSLLTVKSTVKK